jgi:hypothetical protein
MLVRASGMPARREAFEAAGISLDDVLGSAIPTPGSGRWAP